MSRQKFVRQGAAFICALVCLTIAAAPPVGAHGGLTAEQDACVLRFAGSDLKMHFVGYQPDSREQEFCEDIPKAGRTIVALDYFSSSLRNMTTELRIVRDSSGEAAEAEDLDAITEVYLPPEKHPTGTLNFDHNFREGKYVGLVKVKDGQAEYVSRFPFSVGAARPSVILFLYGLIGVVLAASLFWFVRMRKQRRAL